MLHLINTWEIIHQIQAKDVRKPLVILFFFSSCFLGRLFCSVMGRFCRSWSRIFRAHIFWFIGLWILIYTFIGLIYWLFLGLFNFVHQHVIWTEFYAFEIRADQCILASIFGASYLWSYVILDCIEQDWTAA